MSSATQAATVRESAAPGQPRPVRATQSLLGILYACWCRPGLLGRELAWRWLFGAPALLVLYFVGVHLVHILLAANTGIADFSLGDPAAAAQIVASSADALKPAVLHTALWLAPVLALGWASASGLGRSFVIRALASSAGFRPGTLVLLQLVRVLALGGSFFAWFRAIQWSAHVTLYAAEPNFVGYSGLVILFSLGIFSLWALVSWVSAIAPLLAMLEDMGMLGSLRASLRLGRPLTAKLVEINFVLGIVKMALIVLAMVFSATLLPWQDQLSPSALDGWWLLITLLYCAASDFFQVVRLAAFIEFWRALR
jgi:hypothetical protein